MKKHVLVVIKDKMSVSCLEAENSVDRHFCTCIRLFVHFFAVIEDCDVKMPIFTFL